MMHAQMVRRLVATRFRTVTAARDNAVRTGYDGLRYPWESAFTGWFICLHIVRICKAVLRVSLVVTIVLLTFWLIDQMC